MKPRGTLRNIRWCETMKCILSKCNKKIQPFHLGNENAIIPAECDIGEIRKLCSYFQYMAPNIESAQSPLLDVTYHDDVLAEITKNKKEFVFCAHNDKTNKKLSELALLGNVICPHCNRFLCKRMTREAKRDKTRKESDLECLLRHLRNAIAHGHVYLQHGGTYIRLLFEDINDKGAITARIVCCQADLRKWRKILQDAVANQIGR